MTGKPDEDEPMIEQPLRTIAGTTFTIAVLEKE